MLLQDLSIEFTWQEKIFLQLPDIQHVTKIIFVTEKKLTLRRFLPRFFVREEKNCKHLLKRQEKFFGAKQIIRHAVVGGHSIFFYGFAVLLCRIAFV